MYTLRFTLGLLLVTTCMLWSSSVAGQSIERFVQEADRAFDREDFYNARYLYWEALRRDSTRTDLWYRMGRSAQGFGAYRMARRTLERARTMPGQDSIAEIAYYLADTYQRQGNYDEAIALYEAYLANPRANDAKLKRIAAEQIKNAAWAIEEIERQDTFAVKPIPGGVNTRYSEFAPAMRADNFYYTSYRFPFKKDTLDIKRFLSKILRKSGQAEGMTLSDDINVDNKLVAHTAFNHANNRVYFTICEYEGYVAVRCDIYTSEVETDGEWKDPVTLNINAAGVNTTQPNVGRDPWTGQEYLYFASDRSGGLGELDLYRAALLPDGQVSTPENLRTINTAGNDATPFFYEPNGSLYFSTDGRFTFGGYDLYKAVYDGREFSSPRNLGSPINTSYNDTYYAQFEKEKAYLSSNRPDSAAVFWDDSRDACCNDIYEFVPRELELLVLTFRQLDSSELANATVALFEITPDGDSIKIAERTNPGANDFLFDVDAGRLYAVVGTRPGFFPTQASVDLRDYDISQGNGRVERRLYFDQLLDVFVFDKADNRPLPGATISLRRGNSLLSNLTNNESNDFRDFRLDLAQPIAIETTLAGYKDDNATISFTTDQLDASDGRLIYNVYLERGEILPIVVYFDNNQPSRPGGDMSTTTPLDYQTTYERYLGQRMTFINQKTEGMSRRDSFSTAAQYEQFFNLSVRKGMNDLESFKAQLIQTLQRGGAVVLDMVGICSPRASDAYNAVLSARRIDAVTNYLEEDNIDLIRKAISDGRLRINGSAEGEIERDDEGNKIEDRIDAKDSIIGLPASLARRVTISVQINATSYNPSGVEVEDTATTSTNK